METLIIIGIVLIILGIIGSLIPAMPGPILSLAALVLLYISKGGDAVSLSVVILFGVFATALIILDYVAPILGAKFSGASKKGTWGAVAGALAGIIFFPPAGIFIGALAGAILGEMADGKKFGKSLKAGFGVVIGSVMTIFLQVVFSVAAAIYFFINVF
jgi:hypothetical protein